MILQEKQLPLIQLREMAEQLFNIQLLIQLANTQVKAMFLLATVLFLVQTMIQTTQ